MLSCSCSDDAPEYWYEFSDYETMPELPRRKRCMSCKELLEPGDCVVQAYRRRVPRDNIEIAIHGEEGEVVLPSWHYCEACADIILTLVSSVEEGGLGYCTIDLTRSVGELLVAHRENLEV